MSNVPEEAKMSEKKIDGFDKWEVENAARTLIEAQAIEAKPKFYETVKKELIKQAKAAAAAALEAKVTKGLKKLYPGK